MRKDEVGNRSDLRSEEGGRAEDSGNVVRILASQASAIGEVAWRHGRMRTCEKYHQLTTVPYHLQDGSRKPSWR